MPKTIAVLYIPSDQVFGPDLSSGQLMAIFNGLDDRITMPQGFCDYLWFVFVNSELATPEIKLYHEKHYTDSQYDELYKMLKDGIDALNSEQQNKQ